MEKRTTEVTVKPSGEELKAALEEAERIRESGEDAHFLAKSLLYLHQRNSDLEKVVEHAERYIQFGLPVEEHTQLKLLLDEAKTRELRSLGEEREEIGL
jgi:enoyl-CoA hydratase/carnithine racemase